MIYLYPYPEKVVHLNPTDTAMAKMMVELWISFVETGMPQLKSNSTFQWPAMTSIELCFTLLMCYVEMKYHSFV